MALAIQPTMPTATRTQLQGGGQLEELKDLRQLMLNNS